MSLQKIIDDASAQWQRDRAEQQMTLGGLITDLEKLPDGATVENIGSPDSYRGYYCDLAFEKGEGERLAAELLAECRAAVGKVFHGYKGGEYTMSETTPIWIADYGCCGEKIMAINDDGTFATEEDD